MTTILSEIRKFKKKYTNQTIHDRKDRQTLKEKGEKEKYSNKIIIIDTKNTFHFLKEESSRLSSAQLKIKTKN